jgi:hypothetical protein
MRMKLIIHSLKFFEHSMNDEQEFFSDFCWTWSMYLESVAMLPQLYMFIRSASAGGDTAPGGVPGGGTFIGMTLTRTTPHHTAIPHFCM